MVVMYIYVHVHQGTLTHTYMCNADSTQHSIQEHVTCVLNAQDYIVWYNFNILPCAACTTYVTFFFLLFQYMWLTAVPYHVPTLMYRIL